jgi:hypothetical protein
MLANAPDKGADYNNLALAFNALSQSLGPEVVHNSTGSLTVGILGMDTPFSGCTLTGVAFAVATAPTGSAAVFDVLTSSDGSTFTSATGGAGVALEAGQTAAGIVFPGQGLPLTGSGIVRISVLSIGSSVAGAGLTVTIQSALV